MIELLDIVAAITAAIIITVGGAAVIGSAVGFVLLRHIAREHDRKDS